ncbi:MAG: tetratricopeptide repeat protein [Candidatus Latescibacteria bacterium]|nr:tetratricopeptide repeat protein [Candidatus Latescibacterota bacterium]
MAEKLATNIPLVTGVDAEVLPDEAREAIVFLGSILGLNLGEDYDISIQQMDAQDVMMSIFRSIRWFFERLSASKPLILILEDLHYADNISIDVLHYLFENLNESRVMLLLLLRPEKGHPSENLGLIADRQLGENCTELIFDRLKPAESDELVKSLLNRQDVPDPILIMIRNRADGNPFYIEAIVRDLADNHVIEVHDAHPIKILKDLDQVAIPDTIQGMIVSRIDRLPADLKDILQAASVIGPVFKLDLLRDVLNDDLLEEKLHRLYTMDMLYESKTFPEIEYSFKNILIQEAAYSCLLLKRQRELHHIVAAAIEKIYADRIEDYYEILAMHYQNAQDHAQAYKYAVASGRKAMRVFDNPNAIDHLAEALEHVDHVETPEPAVAEVYIWISELNELTGQLDAAIEALRSAIGTIDDDLRKADANRNIGRIFEKQGKKDEALAMYQEVFEQLAAHPDSLEMARLLMNRSWVLNRNRAHAEAIEQCTRALEIFEKHDAIEDVAQAHNNLAVFYESTQDLDTALKHNLKSMKVFSDLNNKRKLGNVYMSLGYVYDKRNEWDTALDYFESSIVTMEKIGNLYGAGTALMAKGRCYMDMGRFEESESVLTRALRIHKELGLNLKIIANELALARVHLSQSDFDSADSYLADARTIAEEDDNRSDLAKVTHLEGMSLARQEKDPSEKYEQAITIFEALGRDRDVQRVKSDLETYRELTTSS